MAVVRRKPTVTVAGFVLRFDQVLQVIFCVMTCSLGSIYCSTYTACLLCAASETHGGRETPARGRGRATEEDEHQESQGRGREKPQGTSLILVLLRASANSTWCEACVLSVSMQDLV